jgi:hypothetical protein
VDSNPRSLSLGSRGGEGAEAIRVVAKDAVQFHGGTSGSNPLAPAVSQQRTVPAVGFDRSADIVSLGESASAMKTFRSL